jgi:hypothetical protein
MALELRRHNRRYILLPGGAQNSPDGPKRIGMLPESFESLESGSKSTSYIFLRKKLRL